MQMDIHCQGFTLTPGLNDYVNRRLAYGLSRSNDAISRVSVRLSDINGPRGGADKRCFIEVRVKAAPAVVIEDIEADLYLAIDRATDRAARSLARRLARRRGFATGARKASPETDAATDMELPATPAT